jgi:hypothetical protein
VGNRVSAEVEIAGLDVPEMGVPGYPEFQLSTAQTTLPVSELVKAETKAAS